MIANKQCAKCGEVKNTDEFYARKNTKDGLGYSCKRCLIKSSQEWNIENAEKVKLRDMLRYIKNKQQQSTLHKKWVENNRDKYNQYMRDWRKNNKEKELLTAKKARGISLDRRMANNAKRRAVARNATQLWANMFIIAEAHSLARERTRLAKVKWVVDHIVPLRGNTVCGFHAHTNIQVITQKQNLEKRHLLWPDMP